MSDIGWNSSRVLTFCIVLVMAVGLVSAPRYAWAAETHQIDYSGSDTTEIDYINSSGDVVRECFMPNYFFDEDGTRYHCVDPHKEFESGTHKSEDATKYYRQSVIDKLGLATQWCAEHVSKSYVDIVTQVFVWKILHEGGYGKDGTTVNYKTVDYNSESAYKSFTTWYEQNHEFYTGYGVVLTNSSSSGAQRVARFWARKTAGTARLTKVSDNASITDGNACYTLEGARYGIWKDEACSNSMGSAYDLVIGEDGTSNTVTLPMGTYWIKETQAPQGYQLDTQPHEVTVQTGENLWSVSDTPLVEAPSLLATKRDVQLGSAQGDATLGGAEFTMRYYDGFFEASQLPDAAKRTWVVRTDDQGRILLSDAYKVGGDDWYRNTSGAIVLPLGTIALQETKPAEGYLLEGKATAEDSNSVPVHVTHVNGQGSFAATIAEEQVIRGGVIVGKVSRETGNHFPQGEASLAGAQIELTYEGTKPISAAGQTFARGDVIQTLVTDEEGLASTEDHLLPYGTYALREVKPPAGFLPNTAWKQTFSIRQDGQMVDLGDASQSVDDQVMRGGFNFNKVDEQSMERMGGAVFLATSNTTGESHVLVADENGIVDTEDAPHSTRTNANDAALTDDVVDESRLDPSAGVWFSGGVDFTTSPNDDMGALPYDTYTIEELPCSVNEDRQLVSFTIKVHRNNKVVNMGTVDDADNEVPEPSIGTVLAFDGYEHIAPASESVTLTDTVRYDNLVVGQTYTLVGCLMDRDEVSQDPEASSICTAQTEFVAHSSSGQAEVTFELDTTELGGCTLVAFEYLEQDGNRLCSHEEATDEAQAVHIPSIGTTLADADGHKDVRGDERISLVDTVMYQNLVPGRSYELVGTLMDKDTGEVVTDANDSPVRATTQFVPDEPDGSTEVTFFVKGQVVAGRSLVAFERLRRMGIDVAIHEDIDDEDQTVMVPCIGTTLVSEHETHEELAQDKVELVDVVAFKGLRPHVTYTVYGTLMDKQTGEPIKDARGHAITSQTTIEPEEADGTVDMPFAIDATLLAGHTIVAFESIHVQAPEGSREIAVHADLDDAEQSVSFPLIRTNATASDGKSKEIRTSSEVKVTDTVTYENLAPGATYVMHGTLHHKQSGEPVLDKNHEPVCAEVEFKPENSTGSVALEFTFDASVVTGDAVVAYESCTREGVEVAVHADITDEEQTVRIINPTKPKQEQKKTQKQTQEAQSKTAGGASDSKAKESSKSTTPGTGDDTMSVVLFVVAGLLILGAGVARLAYRHYN